MRDGPLGREQVLGLLAGDPASLPGALAAAGLAESQLAAAVQTCTTALTHPAVSFRLRLRQGGAEQTVSGRVAGSFVAVATAPGDDRGRLLAGPAQEFPQLLSLLIQLRERSTPDDLVDIAMPYAPIDAFAGVGLDSESLGDLQRTLLGELPPSTLAALFDGQSLRWTLSLWPGADTSVEPPARLDVIDAFDEGMWLIDAGPDPESVVLRPMEADAAWLFLTRALDAPFD